MKEINVMHEKLSKSVLRRLGTLALALCMALSLLPAISPQADAAFSDAAMDKLLNWDVISGYPDGGLHPERSLTRAEFVAMVNRAYGYNELGVTPFIDVPNDAWFRDDINIGYTANYFTGVSPRMAAPDQELTREQAMVLLGRNMRLQPIEGEVIEFTDGHDVSPWSRGYVRAGKEAGVIGGYSNGTYKPQNSITRGEMAVMLERALGTLINKPGTHSLSDVYGNVTISSPNVVLRNSTIAGDLYITGGLSLGDVTLENVRVLGNIIIAGGGESENGESVILRNVQADSLIVDSIAQQYLSLAAEGDTAIGNAILRSSAYVQDRTRPGGGLLTITLDSSAENPAFTLSGNLETVVNKTPNSILNIAMGTVDSLTIDERARNSVLNLDINSTVTRLNLDTATHVTGVGDIGELFVNAPGCVVDMLPDRVTIRPGLTAEIAGQTMNAQQAQESSSDPRLLAGYPRVKNVAPTNATSVYSANKGGTVYWAVSNTTDGSIGEEELIEPTTDNTKLVLSGTTTIGQSNTEYNAALEKLEPDTNYYLSTVMEDARGRRSPIKVASFATPDNTVPAFAQGYPAVMKNYCESVTGEVELNGATVRVTLRDEDGYPQRNYRAQITAMPNKTCQLYYALYPKGSTAPTAQQFRTGALGGPIRSGMEDATKNRINFVELTGLEELTEYDIYLCYIDADGARSSPVQKLTFKTVDGKPPRFQYETLTLTQEQLTSLRLNANVNENATIYWVATKDVNYIKTGNWTETEWWERACRQIESGTGGVSRGTANARANTDVTINVGGLQAATRYYIFFVAKDAAGNYSEFFSSGPLNVGATLDEKHPELYTPHNQQPYKYFLMASTLDNIPPTATQEFTHYDAADPTRPYADTDIRIHFSEAVMQYSTHRDKAPDDFKDFYTLYNDMLDARAKYAATPNEENEAMMEAAENAYFNALRATVKLYNNAATGNDSVPERDAANEPSIGDDWVIDYRKVTVEYDVDTGEMTLVFPSDPDNDKNSALNLASGATYHFVLDDICDTSSNKNRMGRYPLPDFTTISAQVQLRTINVTRVSYKNDEKSNAVESIPIDMAFSMTPISTSVEENVDWDILFWSDTSCAFEIYEISSSANGADAVAIRPLSGGQYKSLDGSGHYSVPISRGQNDEPTDPDTTADNYRGYLGQSYFNAFYGVHGTFPSVTGKGNVLTAYTVNPDIHASGVMERNEPKFYGIHFTSVNTVSEEQGRDKIWDATINFRISVVTATSSANLDNLSQAVNNERIVAFDGDTTLGGSLIHSPKPFTMRKQFANQDAPQFATNFPSFNPEDTRMYMTLMLDRPGTVYYVVAPASEWVANRQTGMDEKRYNLAIPTYAYDATPLGAELQRPTETEDSTKDNYERWYANIGTGESKQRVNVPYNGAENIVPTYVPATEDNDAYFDDKNLTSKFELQGPANSLIYGSSDFGNSRVKTGNVQLGSASRTISVEGLDPETVYFVYFVMQGTGQVYSPRAQLFQFSTTKISPPRMTVTNMTSYASVSIAKDSINATVEAGLFRADTLQRLKYFTNYFCDKDTNPYIRPDRLKEYTELGSDTSGKSYQSYTVWETILAPWGSGSMFDYFANEETKDNVATIIRQRDPNASGGSTRQRNINAGAYVDFDDFEMDAGFVYFFFAMAYAQDTNASGHSISFGGAYPIQLIDNSKPTIDSVTGTLKVDYKSSVATAVDPALSGEINLTFAHPLYLYEKPLGGLPESRAMTKAMVNSTDPSDAFLQDSPNFEASSTDSGAVRTIKIKLKNEIPSGSSFTVNINLCTEFGSPRSSQLQIRLRYDPEINRVYVEVVSKDPTEWFPNDGYALIQPYPVVRPDAVSFTLDRTFLTLAPSESGTITATIYPAGAEGRLDFTWDSVSPYRSAGDITRVSNNSIQVTALESVTSKVEGRIIVRLYVGTDLKYTDYIYVTVSPQTQGRIVANPNRLVLPFGTGMVSTALTVVVDPGKALSVADRAIAGTFTISNNGINYLSVQMTPSDGTNTSYDVYITPTGTKPTSTMTFLITFNPANSALVAPGTVTVILNP